MDKYDFLAPEHRPGGARAGHDDWPWPFSLVPRTWTAVRCAIPPKLLYGKQENFIRARDGAELTYYRDYAVVSLKFKNAARADVFTDVSIARFKEYLKMGVVGPGPIPSRGCLQISVVYAGLIRFPLPYIAYRFKNGFYFGAGLARWTNPVLDQIPPISNVELIPLLSGFRRIE